MPEFEGAQERVSVVRGWETARAKGKQGQMGIRCREEADQDANRDKCVRRLVLMSVAV